MSFMEEFRAKLLHYSVLNTIHIIEESNNCGLVEFRADGNILLKCKGPFHNDQYIISLTVIIRVVLLQNLEPRAHLPYIV